MNCADRIGRVDSVLIADDSRVQREHAVRLCRGLGITNVYEASNGREALELLASLEQAPDLLIIDLEMPTMDGAELLEKLQQSGVNVPIIVASTHASTLLNSVQDTGSALGLRVVRAIQKPLRPQSLRDAIENLSEPVRRQDDSAPCHTDADELRAAMERGEIVVVYQPQVDFQTGAVRGVEALARWQHPTDGLLRPGEFIPLAEANGLIHQLTLQVMNQAMLQTALWNAHGLRLSVAINLSPTLLDNSALAHEIVSLQQCHGLLPSQVILEVTESALAPRQGVAMSVLVRLRLRGFGLSIDDFGTGYSSMQQLARIPFTELKVDRSFVHNAHQRQNVQVILRSALQMAKELGLDTVAEGVETREDWDLLCKLGCSFAQGYWIAKPMSGEELGPWVTERRDLSNPSAATPSNSGPVTSVVTGHREKEQYRDDSRDRNDCNAVTAVR